MKIGIIGAGLTGLSVAYHLEKKGFSNYEIFEKESSPGGLIKTEQKDGFLFDYSGHYLHLNNNYTKTLLKDLLRNNFKLHNRKAGVFLDNKITPYPFQAYLHNVSLDIVKECLEGFVKAGIQHKPTEKSFLDWLINNFGEGFAKHFFVPYNTKLFRVSLDELTSDWARRFIPVPTLDDVIDGIFRKYDKQYGYSSNFYYPVKGGISILMDFFLKNVKKINLNEKLERVDLQGFDLLISTIPLPEFIKVLCPSDKKILEVADKLNYVSVFNINIGLKGKLQTDKHWIYFPEKDKVFYRLGFPSNATKSVVPNGCSSISVEISYNKREKINKERLIEKAISQLLLLGFIKNKRDIIVEFPLDIEYAYVLFDKNRNNAVKTIFDYIKMHNVISIGRYGAWKYSSMEDAIIEGKTIVDRILGKL